MEEKFKQIQAIGFGDPKDEVPTREFNKYLNQNELERYTWCMDTYYFKDGLLVAYSIHGFAHDDYFIKDSGMASNTQTLGLVNSIIKNLENEVSILKEENRYLQRKNNLNV